MSFQNYGGGDLILLPLLLLPLLLLLDPVLHLVDMCSLSLEVGVVMVDDGEGDDAVCDEEGEVGRDSSQFRALWEIRQMMAVDNKDERNGDKEKTDNDCCSGCCSCCFFWLSGH
jgi:hypothetical protein